MSRASEFINFLQCPRYLPMEGRETNILRTIVKIYLLYLLFVGLANGLIIFLLEKVCTLPVDETFEIPNKLKDNLWLYFLLVALIMPVIEEIIFRLPLVFNPFNISLSLSTLSGLLAKSITNWLIAFLIFVLVFFMIYQGAAKYLLGLESFWKRNFKYLFYFLTLTFGLVHIGNYRFTDPNQYWIAPLVVFPQLAMGFVLAFTRMHYRRGFLISILIHVLMNTIAMTIFFTQNKG